METTEPRAGGGAARILRARIRGENLAGTTAPPRRKTMRSYAVLAFAAAASAFAPARQSAVAARATLAPRPVVDAAHAVDLVSTLTVADLPTLVAPKEGELFFTGPIFLVFFPVSIIGGLPFLAWLRLKSLGGADSP